MSGYSDEYFSRSQLRARGWTVTGIHRFLKNHPDETIENWHESTRPIGLFLRARVLKIESSPEYFNWVMRNRSRRAGAHTATQTKVSRLLRKVEEWKFDIEPMDMSALIEAANKHWMGLTGRWAAEYENLPIFREKDRHFRVVHYLRHQLLCNGAVVRMLYRHAGNRKALARLHDRTCNAILQVYPELWEEVESQRYEGLDCGRRNLNIRYENRLEGKHE